MKKFVIGDCANGIETSMVIIEAKNYKEAVKYLLDNAGLYCREFKKGDDVE